MITERQYTFEELEIDRLSIIKDLGYDADSFYEPFPTYLDQALADCFMLKDIKGAFVIADAPDFESSRISVGINGEVFKLGKTIKKELEGSDRLAFFVCTAGKTISHKSDSLLKGDDPVLGYIYDVIGSAIAEAVGDKLQEEVRARVESDGEKITNRYSPGYCHWNVKDQHQLFDLFGGTVCGVSLTPSALMMPVKSISGVFGIGRNVEFHDYQCSLCNLENCVYRDKH
ncbi:vitamin B12 dependent-methionine synthase activation domain-containing protein [Saccharicrinis sp. FJH2]